MGLHTTGIPSPLEKALAQLKKTLEKIDKRRRIMKKFYDVLMIAGLIVLIIALPIGCVTLKIKICQSKYVGASWWSCLLMK